MQQLFNASRKYVIIYASDLDGMRLYHVRERKFTSWIDANCKNWKLIEKICNKYPIDPKDPNNTSPSDFYIYEKRS